MRRGRVKWFSPELGYGFILIEEDVEVFVHHSDIDLEGFRMLHDGEEVEFEMIETQRGFQAKKVMRIKPDSVSGESNHNENSNE
ncbi:MAG TPA: cold shock domain-containing protein [Firmicutes bacterium]|nr:cold shock domain-containing protein [Bacillota bacterium]